MVASSSSKLFKGNQMGDQHSSFVKSFNGNPIERTSQSGAPNVRHSSDYFETEGSERASFLSLNEGIRLGKQSDNRSFISKSSSSILSFFYSLSISHGNEEDKKYARKDQENDQSSMSFYSALTDGFSLNEYELETFRKHERSPSVPKDWNNSQDQFEQQKCLQSQNVAHSYHWQDCDQEYKNKGKNINKMSSSKSHFEIYWSDINYKIKLNLDFAYIQERLKSTCKISSWQRLMCLHGKGSYDFPNEKVSRDDCVTILDHMNGSYKSGELTAVMGPSGAGKTSLLNLISRRREKDYTGFLNLIGTQKKVKICTIPQIDSLPEELSVRENLMFASRLKNDNRNLDHKKNVESIAQLLGIEGCLDTKTGDVSGGEQKRLSIGQELVSKPDVLILDEPTSGLDSLTCYKTLCILKDLVKASASKTIDPIAIVLSIHQPQQEVFELFDKIYMISKGGVPIYNGPPTTCVQYIEEHCGIRMPSEDYNPASFLIEIASKEYGLEPISILQTKLKATFNDDLRSLLTQNPDDAIQNDDWILTKLANNSDHHQQQKVSSSGLYGVIQKTSLNYDNTPSTHQEQLLTVDPRIAKASSTNSGQFWQKARIVLERCWLSYLRDPKPLICRLMYFLVMPLGFSAFIGKDTGRVNGCPNYISSFELKDLAKNDSNLLDQRIQDDMFITLENLGLYFMTIYCMVSAICGFMAVLFSTDIRRSIKEFHNGWYSMSSYLIARIFSEVPIQIILPSICMLIIWTLTGQTAGHGLPSTYRFLIADAGVILTAFISQIFGMIIGTIFIGNITTALFVSTTFTLPMVFLSGFVVRVRYMSTIVYSLSFTSFLRHSLDVIVIARYGFGVCPCNGSEITGKDTQLLNVPNQLKSMIDFWILSTSANTATGSVGEESKIANYVTTPLEPIGDYLTTTTTTISKIDGLSEVGEQPLDLFQLFAIQVGLYNARGNRIRSCEDMIPYQMVEVSLRDKDIYFAFSYLIITLIVVVMMLFVTVKLMLHFRKSL